ncbi:probable insulin-like peptide 2 [Drosophila busckii]|uniref:probable insulin-like peptide 2 n=1 Tax=Drosophila busckii TaxID=30019 RepID=UPI00083F30F9|nr:probable insulin-like peptide 2 [Drosophila busckii]
MLNKVTVTLAVLLALSGLSSSKSCSEELNQVLADICKETGFNGFMSKRDSYAALGFNPIDPVQYTEAKETADLLPYPLSNGRMRNIYDNNMVNSLTNVRRLTRSGIVERCCIRSCSVSDLIDYCSAP